MSDPAAISSPTASRPLLDLKKLPVWPDRPFSLLDNRRNARLTPGELALVEASVRTRDSNKRFPVELVDFSLGGFGIRLPNSSAEALPQLQAHSELILRMQLPGGWGESRCEVTDRHDGEQGSRMGLRRLEMSPSGAKTRERRRTERLFLQHKTPLRGRMRHPLLFDQWTELKVFDINRHMGVALETTDPCALVLSQMTVQFFFDLPGFLDTPYIGEVAWSGPTADGRLRFGLKCLDMSYELNNAICDFLMAYQKWDPLLLRRHGFQANHVRNHLRYKFVNTRREYLDVLGLRWMAYVSAGKKEATDPVESLSTIVDTHSRILTVHHQDRLVGSIGISFPQSEDKPLTVDEGFPGGRVPVPLPPRTDSIEIVRLNTHIGYRGGDLLRGIFEQGAFHFLLQSRNWLVTCAVDELLPLYLRIGFRKVGASFPLKALNNREHHVILCHKDAFLSGRGVNTLVWCAVFGRVVRYMLNRSLVSPPPLMHLAIRFKLMLTPLAIFFYEKKLRRAFRYHLARIQRLSYRP